MSFHKIFSPNLIVMIVLSLLTLIPVTWTFQLESHLSQHGVKGLVKFSQASDESEVTIEVNLTISDPDSNAGEYSWGIYEFPLDYSKAEACHSRMLGRRPIVNFDDRIGKIILPAENGDQLQTFTSGDISVLGSRSIWGRTLVLEGPSRQRVCGSIAPIVHDSAFRVGEARFAAPIAGSVWFSSLSKGDGAETKIFTNLYHIQGGKSSQHAWKLFITDILDSDVDKSSGNCDFLQIMYDPEYKGNQEGCSESEPGKCSQGNLVGKFGKVRVGKEESMFTKAYHTDLNLQLPDLKGPRSLFLVIYDDEHPDSFLACAKVRDIPTKTARASFSHDGIQGRIAFSQRSPFYPVHTEIDLEGLEDSAGGFHVHEFPVNLVEQDSPCVHTAGHFNPFRVDPSLSPPAGTGSFDKYEVGDLSGKYGTLTEQNRAKEAHVDPSLSLYGTNSIVGRSIVIHHSPVPKRWVCANIETEVEKIIAVATFTYPVAGRIFFKQEIDNPLADTEVFVEGLLYSDGTKNETFNHKWHVHEDIPGKDYYNWTGRCLSAGPHFNPFQVPTDNNDYNDCRNTHHPYKCELGDLANKLGLLQVAGKRKDVKNSVRFFTDTNLPLGGPTTIIGKSIVIHDDHAPEHRGNRMACTAIRRQYRHKAVASNWFGNGIPPPVDGRLEFIQDSELATSHTLVDLKGLDGKAKSYHVHVIPVQDHLEFPCNGDAVGGHFNPLKVDPTTSPPAGEGTPDQYEIGDLSGKYGLLLNRDSFRKIYNDTSLPLFGHNSILGRSIVIHKKEKAARWACSTIGWGFDPDEAREIRAIASFHHPDGFAWGYIRFSQVVYRDGSSTDTTMVVRLKYPGKTNKDVTHNHDWSIYVNPVGHDATVKFFNSRCTAAGYRWNPTLIQLADPNDHGFYSEQCAPDQPLRCEVGDLSGRHGKISVGSNAYVFNDMNVPLFGDWFNSAIGKSVVIHTPEGGSERMACGNIEEDKDIVKFATISSRSSKFNLASFMEEVQAIMGIPEWFLYVDSRFTQKIRSGKCLRIKVHFTGPHANRLEQDFTRLLRTGHQDKPSITIPGYVPPINRKTKLSYSECEKEKAKTGGSSSTFNDIYTSIANFGSGSAGVRPSHWRSRFGVVNGLMAVTVIVASLSTRLLV